MKHGLFLFLGLIPLLAGAQVRYLDSVFRRVEVTTEVFANNDSAELKMDIFQPKRDRKEMNRPVILYVHGGGFQGGRRDDPLHHEFCEAFARVGYVTATMSYTFVRKGKGFNCQTPAHEKVETFLFTARDVARATSYLIKNFRELRIDTTKIILIGSSAGAEAVLHAAYWKETHRDSTGLILRDEFKFGGVISLAGAITKAEWITKSSAIPTQLFHGTCDNLVPYGYSSHHYCGVTDPGYLLLNGAQSIAQQLQEVNRPFYLVTGSYGGHEWNVLPIRDYRDLISDFLFFDVLKGEFRQIHKVFPPGNRESCPEFNSFDSDFFH